MPVKYRQLVGPSLYGRDSSWNLGDLAVVDFSSQNFAAAGNSKVPAIICPPDTGTVPLGFNEPYPPVLAAASGNRVAGTGSSAFAVLTRGWIFSRATGGTVYAPAAGATIAVDVVSASGAVQAIQSVAAAVTLSGLTTFWTPFTFAAVPAERQVAPTGTALTTAVQLFNGDVVYVTFTVTALLDVRGNTLLVALEFV